MQHFINAAFLESYMFNKNIFIKCLSDFYHSENELNTLVKNIKISVIDHNNFPDVNKDLLLSLLKRNLKKNIDFSINRINNNSLSQFLYENLNSLPLNYI